MKSYSQALSYLESFVDYEKNLPRYSARAYNLARTRKLLRYLGNPQSNLKAIQIAGTNGKGSTGAMLSSILDEAGFRAGFYSSPHLVSFLERIRINQELIPEEKVCELLDEISPSVERLEREDALSPTFFEVYTAIAFLYFARQNVDYAVLETGLGGRLDATNVSIPVVSIITSISLDHEEQLGGSLVEIATEKCGIIKRKVPVITCSQERDIFEVIRKKSSESESPLTEVRLAEDKEKRNRKSKMSPGGGHDIFFLDENSSSLSASSFNVVGEGNILDELIVPLPGRHQILNAGLAVLCASFLGIGKDIIREGLKKTNWPARAQFIEGKPPILLDTAHNPSASRALAKVLSSLYKGYQITLILGVSSDKDVIGIGNELIPLVHRVILTKADNPRALDPHGMKKALRKLGEKAFIKVPSLEALRFSREISSEKTLICVSGSFFLSGEILSGIQREDLCPVEQGRIKY